MTIRPDYERYTEHLTVEIHDRILTLTLNNPEKLNANTAPMHWALSRIWDDIDADPEVLCVIFTGASARPKRWPHGSGTDTSPPSPPTTPRSNRGLRRQVRTASCTGS